MLSLTAQAQEKRLALLIGNEDYPAVVGRLSLPHQDVSTLDRTLRDLGFDVTAARDLDEDGMDDALSNFERKINSAAGRGEEVVAFLYYSGHGASAVMDGERVNYLLPAKETITTASELARKGIELDEVIRGLSLTSAKAVFVVTDACRNDLVSAFDRSGNKGFAPTRARAGMFIAHSTYPGAVAPDDGAFAQTLARYLKEPGIEAARAFQLTNREVARGRGVTQIPTTANALIEDFYFTWRAAPISDEEAERELFLAAQSCADYQSYAARYPRGEFITVAEVMLASSRCNASAPAAALSANSTISAEDVAEAYGVGRRAYNNKDYVTARLEYTKACDGGLAKGCTDLGFLYREGYGVTQDNAQARLLFQKGCDGGSATGCTNLGVMYKNGYGVAQDYTQARTLYEQGCDGGDAGGCTNLGVLYRNGYGVTRDDAKARALYEQGCDGEDATGCTNLGFLYEKGYGVTQDYAQARTFYQKGCDGGHANGCSFFGDVLYRGLGGPEDKARGIELIRQGCAGGSQWGCDWLDKRDLSR